jgi:hypothetical protein
MLRLVGALLIAGFWLIGTSPVGAVVKGLNLASLGVEEEAKIGVSRDIEGFVDEASLSNEGFFSFDKGLIHKLILGRETHRPAFRIPNRRENNLPRSEIGRFAAAFEKGLNFGRANIVAFFLRSHCKDITRVNKVERGLSAAICVLHQYTKGLSDFGSGFNLRNCWPYPGALSLNNGPFRIFNLPRSDFGLFRRGVGSAGSSFGGLISSEGLIPYRLIDFYHFVNLIADRDKGEPDKSYRYPFSKSFSAVLALLFSAIGAAFTLYSVNKGCEIGGWAARLVFLELPFFAVAFWLLFEGVFGWDARHLFTPYPTAVARRLDSLAESITGRSTLASGRCP